MGHMTHQLLGLNKMPTTTPTPRDMTMKRNALMAMLLNCQWAWDKENEKTLTIKTNKAYLNHLRVIKWGRFRLRERKGIHFPSIEPRGQ